jgi:hypothetical protein
MFIMAAGVAAAVVPVVIGTTVVSVVIGTTAVSVVTGAVVTSGVTVGTGVGVTGAGFWVVQPAHSTLAVIKTAKIRKIRFFSMTEFSTSLLSQECFNLAIEL